MCCGSLGGALGAPTAALPTAALPTPLALPKPPTARVLLAGELGVLRRVSALAGRVERAIELALAGRGGRAPCSVGCDARVDAEGGREVPREGAALGAGGTLEALFGR